MNVVRIENSLAAPRGRGGGRGRGRGRGRASGIVTTNQIKNVLPKYDFKNQRLPLVNYGPTSSSTPRTPRNPRRGQTIRSSSILKSTRGRRCNESSAQTSPRTASSGVDSCIILAITSGRGDARGEVGMAAIDVQYPHMILSQMSDTHAYTNTLSKINALRPIEIIMPDTMCQRSVYPNGLYRVIKDKFENINITGVARMHFHDSAGMDRIKTHCAEEFANVELIVKQKYYALAAASALLKYIEYIQHIVYAPKSMRIEFQGSHNTAMIDIESAQCLDLVTSQGGTASCSLLSSLDRCSTPMGRRLLRASILQPPCDANLITNRLACVEEFVSNKSLHSIVQPVIKRLFGASRLLSLAILTSQTDNVQAAEKNLNYILLLKNIIDIIPELRSVMAVGQAPFFKKVHEDLTDSRYQLIKDKLLTILHEDARYVLGFTSSNMQRCFAIRAGINDMLDIARQTYCELIDDMGSLTDKLAQQYNLPLTLGCNASLGYHIEMDAPRRVQFKIEDLPEEFIEAHKEKSTIFMTTSYLVVLSRHCIDASEELHIMSNVVLNETLTCVREHIGCLLKLNDNVAELDLLLTLAQISAIPDYVKPVFGRRLELIDSRHPVMDIWRPDRPIANDIVASGAYNFHTITGPNMSGKSIYLKQIVLLQIMGQIGCYVPATRAELRITDRIFCRISYTEDIECDASTFVSEIKEAQNILQWVTPNSLVILDELCRSTTVEEGESIAWAICEKLLRTADVFVFNATHYLNLIKLSELYCNVTNHHFETQLSVNHVSGNDSRLIYNHKLKSGIGPVSNYGIALARSTRLSESIVALGQQIANAEVATTLNHGSQNNSSRRLHYDCVVQINRLLEDHTFTVNNIVKLVNELKIPMTAGKAFISAENAESRNADRRKLAVTPIDVTENIGDKSQSSKRNSTTSISSDPGTKKKPKFDLSESSVVESRRSKQAEVFSSERILAMSPAISSNILSHSSQLNSPPTDCRQIFRQTMSVDRMNFSTSTPNVTSENGNGEKSGLEFEGTRPNHEACSTIDVSIPSQATFIARVNAREKEAEIFKMIEGSQFNEAAFYDSFNSTMSLESSDEN